MSGTRLQPRDELLLDRLADGRCTKGSGTNRSGGLETVALGQ